MAQTQNDKEALICTHGDCQELQTEDGEFCEKHYPLKALNLTREEVKNVVYHLEQDEVSMTSQDYSEKDYNKVVEELFTDESCIKCGKSGSFPDGMCERCYKERN